MIRLSFLLIGLAISLNCFSQVDFLTVKKNIEQIRQLEHTINSIFIGFDTTKVAKDYFPGAIEDKEYYPMIFKRTNDDFFPELFVEYYYDASTIDSTIICASYDWEIMHYVKNIFTDGHYFDSEIKRKKDYLRKYNEVKSSVISKIGQPDKIDESKAADGYFYKLEWYKKDIEVMIIFSFSTKLKSVGNFKFGSYKIRLKVDYK